MSEAAPTQLVTEKSIAEKLGNETRRPKGGYACSCPAHDDQRPSLWVVIERGRLTMYCAAGCARDVVIQAAIEAGALPEDWQQQLARGGRVRQQGSVLIEYDWVWANGVYRATHQRRVVSEPGQPKFTWCRYPQVDGGRTRSKMGAGPMPLYNLPELMKADRKEVVWWVEGEKDVETLSVEGLLGVCSYSTGLANKVMCEVLAGRNIVITPDADDAGRRGAAKVADCLLSVGVGRLRVLVLPADGVKGFDLTDWFQAGDRYPEDLEALLEAGATVYEVKGPDDIPWVSWDRHLQLNDEGGIRNNPFNVSEIMKRHPDLRGRVSLDTFKGEFLVIEPLPGDRPGIELPRVVDEISDTDRLRHWLSTEMGMGTQMAWCRAAIEEAADENRCDVLCDWLEGLVWKGEKQLDTWLTDICQIAPRQDSRYVREVSRKFLIGLVARGLAKQGRAPVKVDTMLVLEGGQGIGKSRLVRAMGVRDEWAVESPDLRGSVKQLGEVIRGALVAEVPELLTQTKIDTDHLKDQISRELDTYRPAYARHAQTFPRRVVFIGTLNDRSTGWAKDPTGNRRYWPIQIEGKIDVERFVRMREQLYAEAVAALAADEEWWLEGPRVELQQIQMDVRMDLKPVAGVIQDYIEVDPWSGKAREECLDRVWFDSFMKDCAGAVEAAYGGWVPGGVLDHFQQAMEHWKWRRSPVDQKIRVIGDKQVGLRRRGAWLSPEYEQNAKREKTANLQRGEAGPREPGSTGNSGVNAKPPGTWEKYVSLTPVDPVDPSFSLKGKVELRNKDKTVADLNLYKGRGKISGQPGLQGPEEGVSGAAGPVFDEHRNLPKRRTPRNRDTT